ncbi:MAG: oxygenase MpaB family protein [Actinomycetes bacterium]
MVDVGLFGPGSVTWRVHADPLMGVAGLRALLLQALHPVAMEGVSQHSRFREDTWGRLRDTAEYVGITTFGTTEEALTAGARVRAVHATVRGTASVTGRPYAADDPELLLWVHACLVDSFLTVVRRGGLRLTDAEADAYVAEQVRAAALVGLEPDVVPATEAALTEHLERTRDHLAVTPAAREAAAYVVAPPMHPVVAVTARPAWAGVAGLAFAALPAWARRTYALPEPPGAAGLTEAATTAALRALRVALSGVQAVVPPLREGPHLRAARARLADASSDVGGGPGVPS